MYTGLKFKSEDGSSDVKINADTDQYKKFISNVTTQSLEKSSETPDSGNNVTIYEF
jgi:hypothetical protein